MFTKDKHFDQYGFLPLENAFITDYLPAAKGDQVRVYLYGLFCCQHPREDLTVAQMAAELGMEEAAVLSAFRYWERRGLVTQTKNEPPQYVFYSITERRLSAEPLPQADEAYVEFAESVYSIFGSRRKITSEEVAHAYEWVADLGLPSEVVLMLINHLIATRGIHFGFKQAEPLVTRMCEDKITNAEEADAFFRQDTVVRDGSKKLLRHLGKRREASMDEMKLYTKWTHEWKFSHEAILAACAEMTRGDPSFAYLDSILERLHTGNAVSEAELSSRLRTEKQKRAEVREVIDVLGVNITPTAFLPIYDKWLTFYPHPVIMLAANECRQARSARVEKCEDLLESWHDKHGFTGETQVKAYLDEYHHINSALKNLFAVMDYGSSPTEKDRELYRKWVSYGYDNALLTLAAEQSRQAQSHKVSYLDAVLRAWHEAGITDVSQASARGAQRPAQTSAAKPARVLNAQNYTQREYTSKEMTDLEKRRMQEILNDDE